MIQSASIDRTSFLFPSLTWFTKSVLWFLHPLFHRAPTYCAVKIQVCILPLRKTLSLTPVTSTTLSQATSSESALANSCHIFRRYMLFFRFTMVFVSTSRRVFIPRCPGCSQKAGTFNNCYAAVVQRKNQLQVIFSILISLTPFPAILPGLILCDRHSTASHVYRFSVLSDFNTHSAMLLPE